MSQIRIDKGIALIQVLLITAILSVLVLYFSQTSRQQVKLAQMSRDRAQALVNLHSAQSDVLYELLTRQKLAGYQEEQSEPVSTVNWNFYAQPFKVSGSVTATIQDQAGLLSAQFANCTQINALLEQNGVDYLLAQQICRDLLDWQDLNTIAFDYSDERERFGFMARNGRMPDLSDLQFFPRMTPEIQTLLRETLTLHYVGRFNPMTAPPGILLSVLPEGVVDQVIEARGRSDMTKRRFSEITGIVEDEETWFTPSSFIELKLISETGNVRLTKSWVMSVNPYLTQSSPVNIIESRG